MPSSLIIVTLNLVMSDYKIVFGHFKGNYVPVILTTSLLVIVCSFPLLVG